MILLLIFSFLAGLATILAPCIWPVLPIVLSSTIAGESGRRRPLGVVLGVMLSFAFFTLSISYLVHIFNLNPNVLRTMAVIVIAFFGFTMLIPALGIKFEIFISKISSLFGRKSANVSSGFAAGFATGLSLGILWTPCAGPILATIATLAATGKVNLAAVLVTLAYSAGVGVPLFAFAYGGKKFISKAKGLSKYTGKIQRAFGAVMILAAIAIFTNYDQTLQLQLLNKFPILGTVANGFENSSLVTNQLAKLKGTPIGQTLQNDELFNANYPAPDFVSIDKWLNTDQPISIANLKGKVVLVDFWTYSCINCIRSLPFVTAWYDKYSPDGFVVIGVHTPEFQFEHDSNNVLNAIKMYNIHYPVAQDNEYATWNNYQNEYWPAEYLIDTNGIVRRTHFGEGEYNEMEMAIQTLLKEAGQNVSSPLSNIPDQTPQNYTSPETYLGSAKMQYYYPSGSLSNGTQTFSLSNNPPGDSFSLGGTWNIMDEYASSEASATLIYNFTADKVFIILNPGNSSAATVQIYLDGKVIDPTLAGTDVKNGIVTVDSDRLYNVVDLHGKYQSHVLKLEFQTPGTQAYTFTFG